MTNGKPTSIWLRNATALRRVNGRWLDFHDQFGPDRYANQQVPPRPPSLKKTHIDALKTESKKNYASPYLLAANYALLGDKQQALAYLDETLRQHGPSLLDLQNDSTFDFPHSAPHYRAIMQKVGLPPAR